MIGRTYEPGDRVAVVSGPFQGYEGVVASISDGGTAIHIRVQLFGNVAPLILSPEQLDWVDDIPDEDLEKRIR